MKKKASKIMLWIMLGIASVWAIFFLLCLSKVKDPLEFWAWGVLAIITGPAIAAVLAILGFVRYSMRNKNSDRDRILFRFSQITTITFAVLTLTAAAVRFLLNGDGIRYPWSYIDLSSSMERMGLAFGASTLISLLVGFLCQFIIKSFNRDNQSKKAAIVRTIGISLTAVICLAILFVPNPSGSYNDGGSKKYESVLYEVIDWNRTQEFDGTSFYEENQKMRIYFFPFNCYEYEAKWGMRH